MRAGAGAIWVALLGSVFAAGLTAAARQDKPAAPAQSAGRVFDTHHIPMDVYHGRKVRPVNCPPSTGR